MVGIISNPVKSLNSHNGGWTLVCKSIIEQKFDCKLDILSEKDNWDLYDILIINEGVNFKSGIYNFFGGVQESTEIKLNKLKQFTNKVYSINQEIDYNDMCKKRKELKEFNYNFKIPEVLDLSTCFTKLILGDSHSISVYKPKYSISRNDGKTLHGFLKNGIKNYIENLTEELVFYAGNIDVRFHINRIPYPENNIENLCYELEKQLKELNLKKISLVGLLPIENESRKIPGTGKYKGQCFYGSQNERMYYVRYFNKLYKEMCKRNNWTFLEWDFNYEKELSFNNMEAKQSVHLRPSSYMFTNELINTQINTLF